MFADRKHLIASALDNFSGSSCDLFSSECGGTSHSTCSWWFPVSFSFSHGFGTAINRFSAQNSVVKELLGNAMWIFLMPRLLSLFAKIVSFTALRIPPVSLLGVSFPTFAAPPGAFIPAEKL